MRSAISTARKTKDIDLVARATGVLAIGLAVAVTMLGMSLVAAA